jgi:hypothetical protein
VDSGFVASDGLNNVGTTLIQNGSQSKAYELRQKTAHAIEDKLRKYNYDRLESREETRIGDIRLVAKNLVHQKGAIDLAIKSMETLPTGQGTNVDRAVDISSGNGQRDVGVGVVTDWQYIKASELSVYAGAEAQLPANRSRRIPYEYDSKLSPGIDANTRMNLGDVFTFQVGNKYSFLKGMSLTTAYTMQYKGKDRYSGSEFARHRYKWMETDTAQSMESVHLALGHSEAS